MAGWAELSQAGLKKAVVAIGRERERERERKGSGAMTGRTGGRLRYYSLFLLYLFFFSGGRGEKRSSLSSRPGAALVCLETLWLPVCWSLSPPKSENILVNQPICLPNGFVICITPQI